VSYRVTVRARPTTAGSQAQVGRCDISEADFGMNVDDLLKKVGIAWHESKREGQITATDGKKRINSGDTLQRIGIRSVPPHTHHCTFKLPAKSPAPQTSASTSSSTAASTSKISTQPRAPKPHKTGTFEQLKMEFRIFLDEGNCLINLRGQSKDFKGDTELSMKKADYERMTVDELNSKLGRRWPALDNEGWFQTSDGPVPFNGTDRLISIGCIVDSSHTSSYHLVFPIGDHERPNPDLAAAKAAAAERAASSRALNVGATVGGGSAGGGSARGGISEGSIGVNVRMFFDNGFYNLQLTGAGGDWKADTDVTVKKDDYASFTFGDLKKKLRRWPETTSSGKLHSPKGNFPFTDQDKLVSVGLTATDDGRPTVHQFTWDCV